MFMPMFRALCVAALPVICAATGGCFTRVTADSPIIIQRLQMVSAGHTGCVPEENEITKVKANLDGSGLWYATCKGKTYLCSAVGSTGGSESFSCAPLAQ